MNDNELDDLFRRNADYLANEPPRDFDKVAFWQQLQTELPKKSQCPKAPAAWWWAAASVLLAGMLGGIWWMQSAELSTKEELSGKAEVKTSPSPWSVSSQTRDDAVGLWRHRPRIGKLTFSQKEKSHALTLERQEEGKYLLAKKEKLEIRSSLSDEERFAVEIVEKLPGENPLPIKSKPVLPDVVAPAIPEKPVYRMVHINEIRQRKQQEAKARSRVAFQIGIPVPPPPIPESSADEFSLSISIPH